jgi:hypothetical protein
VRHASFFFPDRKKQQEATTQHGQLQQPTHFVRQRPSNFSAFLLLAAPARFYVAPENCGFPTIDSIESDAGRSF